METNLNLLFFLSALLAGITGAISGGQRTDSPAVQQSLTRALEVSVEADVQIPVMLSQNLTVLRRSIDAEWNGQFFWALTTIVPASDVERVNEKLLV